LYALGDNQVGSNFVCWAYRWTGVAWEPAPPGLYPDDCSATPFISGDLGDGMHIYGQTYAAPHFRVAKWGGTAWIPLSDPIFLYGYKLIMFDDGAGPRLYLLGGINTIGGVEIRGFGRWVSGTTWERPPSDHSAIGTMYDLASFNDGSGPALWAYGLVEVNAAQFRGIGKWNGQTWTDMGGPAGTNVYARRQIESFDDGSGPALYVTGQFLNWGGVSARGIVRWNGQAWSGVGAGIFPGSEVYGMAAGQGAYGPTLYVGGGLSQAGGGVVRYVAQYVGCPNCYANCDLSTSPSTLNVNDFVCFMQKFIASDPYANCDNSTAAPAINVNDFVCFATKFAAVARSGDTAIRLPRRTSAARKAAPDQRPLRPG
jgi:hypothetical protein